MNQQVKEKIVLVAKIYIKIFPNKILIKINSNNMPRIKHFKNLLFNIIQGIKQHLA